MDNSTAALLGEATGCILACLPLYLLGLLVGLFFKAQEPEERAIAAAIGAWIAVYVIAGFGFAREPGEFFSFGAGIFYIPAACLAFLMLRRHYRRLWEPDTEELSQTFE